MSTRGLIQWLQNLRGLLRAYARPLAVLLVSIPVTGYAINRSFTWLDRPFPGFFLVSGAVVSTVSGSRWPARNAAAWPSGDKGLFLSRVVAIDGSPVRTRSDVYDYVAAHARHGDAGFRYVFRRDGADLAQRIEPRIFSSLDYWETVGLLLIFGCLSLGLALVVGFLQPRTRQARVYLTSGLVAGMYTITGTLLYQPDTSLLLTAAYLLSECLFPATTIHLSLVFPVERRLGGARRLWLAIPYVIGATLAAVGLHGFYAEPPNMSVWPLTWAYTVFAFLFFYGTMIFAYWENREPLARPRLKAMLVWLVAATVPVLVVFANNVFPQRGFPLQYSLVLCPIFFASVAYSIAKHDLFDVDRFVRQAFAYGLLTVVVIGAYALVLLIPGRFAEENPGLVGVLFVLALAIVLDPLRRGMQRLVDRAYYRERWDYRKTIGEQSQAMTTWLDMEAIVRHVMHIVTNEMHLESTTLCLFDEGEKAIVWSRDVDGRLTQFESTALALLDEGDRALVRSKDTEDSFTQSEMSARAARALIDRADMGIVLPLTFQAREIGQLKLGRKLSGRPFTVEDRDLLQTLANQAALAIQNARLHQAKEELRCKNDELARAYSDLKQAETQLVQSEKMASLGRLVAGTAHQLNNPASFVHGSLAHLAEYVQGFVEVIRAYEQVPLRDGAAKQAVKLARESTRLDYLLETTPTLLRVCSEGSDRIKQIVDDLRTFARADQGERVATDVAQTIESALRLIDHRINREGIAVEKDFQAVPPIQAQPAQLSQVWMNLLGNAADAVEGRPHPVIRVAVRFCPTALPLETAGSGCVEVKIADNGAGIAPGDRERIFEPFFTTKPIGRGTGLGLSIAYGAVQSHSGTITVNSEPGDGTTVRVWLPLTGGLGVSPTIDEP